MSTRDVAHYPSLYYWLPSLHAYSRHGTELTSFRYCSSLALHTRSRLVYVSLTTRSLSVWVVVVQ